jgi:hypothetical protein
MYGRTTERKDIIDATQRKSLSHTELVASGGWTERISGPVILCMLLIDTLEQEKGTLASRDQDGKTTLVDVRLVNEGLD